MKCEQAIVYYSKGKPVAYSLLVNGIKKPTVPEGLKAAKRRLPEISKYQDSEKFLSRVAFGVVHTSQLSGGIV